MDKVKKIKLGFTPLVVAGLLLISSFFVLKYSAAQSATDSIDNADAIAVRIVPNPNHYSVSRWYTSQGFAGSPQTLIVDGYEAIRDGRTVYVGAANVDYSVMPTKIYTNIYLISYNQDPAPNTVDILGQIVKYWKFNTNLPASSDGTCAISSLSCLSDMDCGEDQYCAGDDVGLSSGSCVLKTSKNCLTDTNCPTNFFCDSVKAKITRDMKRVGQLEELKETLAKFKNLNNSYPTLSAGTYLSRRSISVWPSWPQAFLAELAVGKVFRDPINRLGPCSGYDPTTCWNEETKRFVNDPTENSLSLILPAGSYAFAYSADRTGSNYNLCATLETAASELGYEFSPAYESGSACVIAGISTDGQAGNTPPRLVDKFLIGAAGQEFSGFIKMFDAENNPLSWSLDTSGADWTSWSKPPYLVDTSDPNQKKVYSSKAGQPGVYNVILTVNDGREGISTASLPITILGLASYIEAENAEYTLDPTIPFDYSFFFSGKNFVNPGVSTVLITKTGGPFNFFTGLSASLSEAGEDRYKINYHGLISPTAVIANSVFQDTIFNYHIVVTDKDNTPSTKNFSVKIKTANPQLNFNCPEEVRVGQEYNCLLGSAKQGSHTLTYTKSSGTLPVGLSLEEIAGLSSSAYYLSGSSTQAIVSREIIIKATNEYGASATKAFNLKINNYCGDNQQQLPNSEGREGLFDDGYEDCDGAANISTTVIGSSRNKQYGCTIDCVFKSPVFTEPVDKGGYCGDGYCQCLQDANGNCTWETCKNCYDDCGNCKASIESYANQEQIAFFNGQRIYKTNTLNELGKAERTVPTGNNILGFWTHAIPGANNYGLAYRMLIGPVSAPYDVMDTTNSALRCASSTNHNFGGNNLSDPGYEPIGELTNSGYNWTEIGFTEAGSSKVFATSSLLSRFSILRQVNISAPGATVANTFLPFVWGEKNVSGSTAYYCRLTYNYNLNNFGVCRPRCQERECGADNCGDSCGSCAVFTQYTPSQTVCSSAGKCVCTPISCVNKDCGADGCGGDCGICSSTESCIQRNNGSTQCCPQQANIQTSVDDYQTTYFNGEPVAYTYKNSVDQKGYIHDYSTDTDTLCPASGLQCWRAVQEFKVTTKSGKNVIAIKAEDVGTKFGLAATLNQAPCVSMTTSEVDNWKCTGASTPPASWNTINFNDSSWPSAKLVEPKNTELQGNALYPDGVYQIWASDAYQSNTTIYCRYTFYSGS